MNIKWFGIGFCLLTATSFAASPSPFFSCRETKPPMPPLNGPPFSLLSWTPVRQPLR